MKLYEINEKVLELTDQIYADEETGEVVVDDDTLFEQIFSLQMERKRILEYLAKLVLNTRSEVTALKTEEARLKDRRNALAQKEERIMRILDRECNGEKTDLGVATVSYRKTARVEISDSEEAVEWLRSNDHSDCLRIPEPEVAKSEVKKLITAGMEVPGCTLVEDYSCSLK